MKFDIFKKNISLCMMAAVFPLAMLFFLFNPALILYKPAFYPAPPLLWGKLAGFALLAGLAGWLLAFVLHFICKKLFSRWGYTQSLLVGILHALFLLFFMITLFFPLANPMQDGAAAAEPSLKAMLKTYLLYGAVFLGFVFMMLRKRQIFDRVVCMAFIFAVGVSFYVAAVNSYNFHTIQNTTEDSAIVFGAKRNIIVIVADMLQGSSVELALREFPELAEKLPGFTLYARAVSPHAFTTFALPAILSGKIYAADPPTDNTTNREAADRDSLFTDTKKAGFELLYLGGQKDAIAHRHSVWDVLNYVDLGFMRILKKRLIHRNNLNAWLYSEVFYWKKRDIGQLHKLLKADADEQADRLIFQHNLFTHAPHAWWEMKGNELSYRPDRQDSYDMYISEIRFFLEQVGLLAERLQELGLYNQSGIIIVGDHGHPQMPLYASPDKDSLSWLTDNGFCCYPASSYNPVLLVKEPGADGFSVSHEHVPTTAVRGIIGAWLNGETDYRSVFAGADTSVALIEKKPTLHQFYSTESHHVVQVDSLSSLADIIQDESKAPSKYSPVKRNTQYLFSSLSIPFGFIREERGAWLTDRGGVCIELEDVDLSRDCKFIFKGSPLTKGGILPRQRIIVRLQDGEPQTLIFEPGTGEVILHVTAEELEKSQGKIRLIFEAPDAVTPAEIGAWDFDAMPISVFFTELEITQ